jgi:hypothetical protein
MGADVALYAWTASRDSLRRIASSQRVRTSAR